MKKLLSLPYVTETNMIAFRHQIGKMLDRPFLGLFFGHLLYDVFDEGSNSVHLSEQLANFIKISEEH